MRRGIVLGREFEFECFSRVCYDYAAITIPCAECQVPGSLCESSVRVTELVVLELLLTAQESRETNRKRGEITAPA